MSQPGLGTLVILNGAPRSGKTSIAREIQNTFDGVWMNLGVDAWVQHVSPQRLHPGIGLRPGGERPDLEPFLLPMYLALYDSAAAHARQGLNVVMDVGHHDGYQAPRPILSACARRVAGLPAIFVGVRCPLDEILRRRNHPAEGRQYVTAGVDEIAPSPVLRWQEAVHNPGIYDLEVDTALLSPSQCAQAIARILTAEISQPNALSRLSRRNR